MITCKRCGKDNQDHYKFCLGCGSELSQPPAEAGQGSGVGMMKTVMANSGANRATPTPPGGMPHQGYGQPLPGVAAGGPGYGAPPPAYGQPPHPAGPPPAAPAYGGPPPAAPPHGMGAPMGGPPPAAPDPAGYAPTAAAPQGAYGARPMAAPT
ncbi:MAG TPA: hypothetical protein VFG83_07595, partial [Kofleriaceae bacterium]|nr:hypothetical protein [Kofleriaceae bacterium]